MRKGRSEPGSTGRQTLRAWLVGTLNIMWFALRRPGRAAWINHETGEVRPARNPGTATERIPQPTLEAAGEGRPGKPDT